MYSLDFIIHKTYVYTDNPNFSTKIINFGRFNTKIYSSKLTQLKTNKWMMTLLEDKKKKF